tara:strand:+ start:1017 stop:1745 length:729 start_codon:yes stop_codon:yes gene_type:complete
MKRTTINKEEIDKFSKIADEWWSPDGKFKPLHKFNPIRIKYIRDSLIKINKKSKKNYPLNGLNILDIGCGGGLLSEPISRLGANVTGIDASQKNINIAKTHLKKSKLEIKYFCASPENFKPKKKFDVILNMEIVEHVSDINLFISQTSKLLKKDGIMFIATINKTLKSYIFAIIGAEYILRWLPIGTHNWEKFVEPESLKKIAESNSLYFKKLTGVKFSPVSNNWKLSTDSNVNYIMELKKN